MVFFDPEESPRLKGGSSSLLGHLHPREELPFCFQTKRKLGHSALGEEWRPQGRTPFFDGGLSLSGLLGTLMNS